MEITYDLDVLPERRGGTGESEEVTAIKIFLASTHKNMCFEYDDEKDAKRRYDTVRRFRGQQKLQEVFDLYRRGNCVYILRVKKQNALSGAPGKKKRAAPSGANAEDSRSK